MKPPAPDNLAIHLAPLALVASFLLYSAVLAPLFSYRRSGSSNRAVCASNLRGIGQGMAIYATENENQFPVHYFAGRDDDVTEAAEPETKDRESRP